MHICKNRFQSADQYLLLAIFLFLPSRHCLLFDRNLLLFSKRRFLMENSFFLRDRKELLFGR
jgi:hypothetical protein